MRDRGQDLAAIIAFHALLALAPAFYLSAVSLGWIFRSAVDVTLLAGRVGAIAPPLARESLEAVVQELTAPPTLVPLAVPALLWVVATAFGRIERALRVALGAQELRPGFGRLRGLAIFAGCWSLLGASLVLLTVRPHLSVIAGLAGLLAPPGWLVGGASSLALLAVTGAAFATLYRFLPRPSIRWKAAIGGAFLALVGWEALRRLFAWVLLGSPGFGLIAGTFAGTIALLLWIYGGATVVLLGAEFAAILDGRRQEPASVLGSA